MDQTTPHAALRQDEKATRLGGAGTPLNRKEREEREGNAKKSKLSSTENPQGVRSLRPGSALSDGHRCWVAPEIIEVRTFFFRHPGVKWLHGKEIAFGCLLKRPTAVSKGIPGCLVGRRLCGALGRCVGRDPVSGRGSASGLSDTDGCSRAKPDTDLAHTDGDADSDADTACDSGG